MKKTAIAVMATLAMVYLAGCESFVLKTVMGTVDPYFHVSNRTTTWTIRAAVRYLGRQKLLRMRSRRSTGNKSSTTICLNLPVLSRGTPC